MKLSDLDAILIAEGEITVFSKAEWLEAWQHLIDTGLCWKLQGRFGRQAQQLIDEGSCKNANFE